MVSLCGKFEQEGREEGGGGCRITSADGGGQLSNERHSIIGLCAMPLVVLCALLLSFLSWVGKLISNHVVNWQKLNSHSSFSIKVASPSKRYEVNDCSAHLYVSSRNGGHLAYQRLSSL